MRILLIGAGGVGSAAVAIASRRPFFDARVVADYDLARARRAIPSGDRRFTATRLDASNSAEVAELCRAERITHVFNAVDPRFVMPIFAGAFEAGADYLDMAMSLSRPHPSKPFEETGVKLGDEQFAAAAAWAERGRLALVGIGVEPGLSDVFARYAADELFDTVDEIGVRDGANLVVDGYDFAPSFSVAPVRVGGVEVSPRDVVAACLPDPATLGDRMHGKTCAGTWVRGSLGGAAREVYLYHVVDNEWSMSRDGSQAVVWQTAVNPVVALELPAAGAWSGEGVLGPEALTPSPFLELLNEHGAPWEVREQ